MKSLKKVMVSLLVFTVILSLLGGCSSSNKGADVPKGEQQKKEEKSAPRKDPEFIRIGTASLGGSFFPMGTAIGTVIESVAPGIKCTAEATGGSVFNMNAIQEGELEMAIVQGTSVAEGMSGKGQFKDGKTTKVRTIANYHSTPQHIVVRADLDVKSIKDLKGLKLEMIAAGDGVEVSTKNMLASVGITWDQIKPQYSGNRVQAASRLKTGEVDGIIDGTGIGAAWLVDVIGNGKFKLISLTDDEIKTISTAYPEFSKVKIPAGTYKGQNEDVYAVSSWTVIVSSDTLSDDLVYKITKGLFENKSSLEKKNAYFNDLVPETIKDAIIAPLHPGAEKFYKEKGILK